MLTGDVEVSLSTGGSLLMATQEEETSAYNHIHPLIL